MGTTRTVMRCVLKADGAGGTDGPFVDVFYVSTMVVAEVAGGGRLGVEHVEDVGCAVGQHGGGEPTVVSLLTADLNAPTTVFVFVVQPPVLTNGTAWS